MRERAQRTRILYFFGTDADYGGAGRILLNLIRGIDTERFEPVVMVSRPGPIMDEMRGRGIECRAWPRHDLGNPLHHAFDIVACAWMYRRERIDLIHMNYGCLGWKPAELPAARLARVPVITHLQQAMDEMSPYFQYSSMAVTCSRFVAERSKLGKVLPRPVYDVVCTLRFGSGHDLRSELGLPPDCRVASFIGRARRRKGLAEFVELARHIPGPDVRFLISTQRGGPMADAYTEADIEALVATDARIKCIGFRPDVENVYATSDVVVFPSQRAEACAAVLLEAGASRRPVVATTTGSTPEFITDGENGFLVEPTDIEGMAHQVRRLLDDAVLRRRMGERGREIVEQRFALDPIAGVENIYTEFLARRGRAA